MPNKLAGQSSPYLKQHAANPVNWYPWGTEALDLAQKLDKPILISIGYSACHWCHVMEHESFENPAVAEVMNQHLVCIKIDREERPDLDGIYMDAVQAMGVRGGWPLNVFLLPNKQPFYGGTYFPASRWTQLIKGIADAFNTKRPDLESSAAAFTQDLNKKESEKFAFGNATSISLHEIKTAAEKIAYTFDKQHGGLERAPKFPMPSVWHYILWLNQTEQNLDLQNQLKLTLSKIALGGIFDAVEGGWCRYSTDAEWKLPHFEKMLYDNAQLMGCYADALRFEQLSSSEKTFFENCLSKTFQWLKNDLCSLENAFYAALDADSEGEEGKYYTWTFEELNPEADFAKHFHLAPNGNFHDEATGHETGLNILHASTLDTYHQHFNKKLAALKQIRQSRIKPGLDTKVLFSWNALMIKGLCKYFLYQNQEEIKESAIKCGAFLFKNMAKTINGHLHVTHSYSQGYETSFETSFLEDYATGIEACCWLYQISFDDRWILKAEELAMSVNTYFADPTEPFYFFTKENPKELIARKKEIFDNVIPSSNSILANALYLLGRSTLNHTYTQQSENMFYALKTLCLQQIDWASNWGILGVYLASDSPDVVVYGKNAFEKADYLKQFAPITTMFFASESHNDGMHFSHKNFTEDATVYICYKGTCLRPTQDLNEAKAMLI